MTDSQFETTMQTSAVPTSGTVDSNQEGEGLATPRHGVLLPILAAVLLVVGLGVAVGGLMARSSADESAKAATADLVVVTSDRDAAQLEADRSTAKATDAATKVAVATTEGQRVSGIATGAASIADQLCDCDQRISNATKELAAAVVTRDAARAQRAINAFNAAVDEANAALLQYDAAIEQLYTFGVDGSVSPV